MYVDACVFRKLSCGMLKPLWLWKWEQQKDVFVMGGVGDRYSVVMGTRRYPVPLCRSSSESSSHSWPSSHETLHPLISLILPHQPSSGFWHLKVPSQPSRLVFFSNWHSPSIFSPIPSSFLFIAPIFLPYPPPPYSPSASPSCSGLKKTLLYLNEN